MKKKLLLLAAVLTVLMASGCGRVDSVKLGEAVNQNDAAMILSEKSPYAEAIEIFPDYEPGIYINGQNPYSLIFTWDSDAELRYSTTCSEPDSKDRIAEDGKVFLDYRETGDGGKSRFAIVRCALFEGEEQVSDIHTFVYISTYEDRFNMPVYSLVSDPTNYFSDETGILVGGDLYNDAMKYGNPPGWDIGYDNANYYMRGMEWERPTVLTVFDEDGTLELSQDCGVRVSGGWTRNNTQKSLRLYARREYTENTGVFAYPFWGGLRGTNTGNPIAFSDTVVLRGGGNNEGNGIINTPMLLGLIEGTDLDPAAVQPVVQLINGKYKGVLMQIEDYDTDYFTVHYGIPTENVTTMKGSVPFAGKDPEVWIKTMWSLDDGPEGEKDVFDRMISFIIENDMSIEENYEKAKTMIDMRNFVQYIGFMAYIGNGDWPDNNQRAWRYNGNDTPDGYDPDQPYGYDGRWRFLIKDLDCTFGYRSDESTYSPFQKMLEEKELYINDMYRSLIKNDEFRDLFSMYMCTLAKAIVTPERLETMMDNFMVRCGQELVCSIQNLGLAGGSRGKWNSSMAIIRDYARIRTKSVMTAVKKFTERENADITVNITGNGSAELGWYEILSGETRRYIRNTRIPLEIFCEDGMSYITEITGGYISEEGYLIAEEESCTVNITFSGEKYEYTADHVVINEISCRGDGSEWLELYNPTDIPVSLFGWSVGKREDPVKAEKISGIVLEPNGFMLICFSDYANSEGYEGIHIPMSVSSEDTVYLFDSEGEIVDSVSANTVSKTIHPGRLPDGGEWTALSPDESTPGSANTLREYAGFMVSENFKPYLLAWGRAYEYDAYFYEKDGTTFVKTDVLRELCEQYSEKLLDIIGEFEGDITLDKLIEVTDGKMDAEVRRVPAFDSVIIR